MSAPIAGGGPALDGFSEADQGLVHAPPSPRRPPAQAQAWAAIGRGENTLVIAPTGSGKTLAAFLWAHRQAGRRAGPGRPEAALPGAVHLAAEGAGRGHRAQPALAADRRSATPRGASACPSRTSGSACAPATPPRTSAAGWPAKPPDILITTPESLFLLLTSQAREALRSVETVIVDEVHALAGSKRGAHLALSLERLDALRSRRTGREAPAPADRAVGDRPARRGGGRRSSAAPGRSRSSRRPASKRIDLQIVVPVEDMADLETAAGAPGDGGPGRPGAAAVDLAARRGTGARPDRGAPVHDRVRQLAPAGRAALRPAQRAGRRAGRGRGPEPAAPGTQPAHGPPAEIMAQAGATGGAPAEVARAHHGSVSRQERTQIEEALKAGRLPAVVATSSLELGIDMGAVDLVIQVESPPSVASGLQRTGRAGHNVGDVSRGVIFPKYQGDLVQATVVARRMRDGADRGAAHAAQPARRAGPADRRDDRDGRLGRSPSWSRRSGGPRRSPA